MKRLLFIVLAAAFCLQARAADQDTINREIYGRVASAMAGKENLSTGDLTVQVALSMLGTPYVGGTLEGGTEELRIFLDKTDCILFVESCICIALTLKGLAIIQGDLPQQATPSYELYCDNVRNMRYRGGAVDGYSSRIHYTSEWILQAEKNGILKEYTEEIGIPKEQHFSFMTSHADLYPRLKESQAQTELVRAAEKNLEAAGPYHYVSRDRLNDPEKAGAIRSGDIVFIISGAEGLDIAHVAIAYGKDGAMHFIHASSKEGKVIVEPRTLAEYASRGVRLARLR